MSYHIENKEINTGYSSDEICPVCGVYSPDGDVCVTCQKEYGIYKPKITYNED